MRRKVLFTDNGSNNNKTMQHVQSLIELDERLVTSLKNVLKYDNTFEVIWLAIWTADSSWPHISILLVYMCA